MEKVRYIIMMLILMTMSYHQTIGQSKLNKANSEYEKLAYTPAIDLYEDILKKEDNFEAMWKLADCYRLTNSYKEAEYWYGRVVQYSEAEPVHLLYYAQVLQTNENYGEAVKWYSKYREYVPGDSRADNQMKASQNYRQYYVDADRYKLVNMPFNSSKYDFGPVYYKEGLVFSSSRDSAQSIERIHTWTGEPFFDLYYVEKKGEASSGDTVGTGAKAGVREAGEWSKPKDIKGRVNTKYHEGPIVITADGSTVYFTRNNFDNSKGVTGKVGKSSDKIVKLKLYTAKIEGDKWIDIKEFAYNNDEYSVGHAAIDPSGEYLYFVSDMPGGYGGTDIYVSEREGEGGWGIPMNLGPVINTEGNEMFPYMDKEGVLYFASDGHGGLGGLDIFKVKGSGTEWGSVKNMGAPLNSSYDDFGLIFNEEGSEGFITSNRPGGAGSDDIYGFINDGITLEGIVVDAKTGEPICASDVDLMYQSKIIAERKTVCDGEFEFSVLPGRDYELEGCAEGYTCEVVAATTKGVKPGGKVFVKIPLKKIEALDLEVLVIDRITRNPIPESVVLVQSLCSDEMQEGRSDVAGMSYYKVMPDCEYDLSGNASGYLPGRAMVSTRGKTGTVRAVIELDQLGVSPDGSILLPDGTRLYPGDPGYGEALKDLGSIVLHHIYYDFDKSYIREEASLDLSVVLEFMKANPNTIVEIGSHTDARASYAYNIALSERRAKAAVEWLVKRGVARKRLVATGYGESQPVNHCVDNIPCSEEEHQRNRRTEFRVVGGDIDIKSIHRVDIIVDPCRDCPF